MKYDEDIADPFFTFSIKSEFIKNQYRFFTLGNNGPRLKLVNDSGFFSMIKYHIIQDYLRVMI